MKVEDYVKTLTPKQVVELMIDAIENPVVTLDFDTFGTFDGYNCMACAATNMAMRLCKIEVSDDPVKTNFFENVSGRSDLFKLEWPFLDLFESAIDHLRCGRIIIMPKYLKCQYCQHYLVILGIDLIMTIISRFCLIGKNMLKLYHK